MGQNQKRISWLPQFLQPPPWLTTTLTVEFISHFILILISAILFPLVLRYLFLPQFYDFTQPLDFTFETCQEKGQGICSFYSATVNLLESDFQFQKGTFYGVYLDIVIPDTPPNRQLKTIIATLQPKGSIKWPKIKKPINLKWSWFKGMLIWWRNLFFYPLYLVGILDDNSMQTRVTFTERLISNINGDINRIEVAIENRFIEIRNGLLQFRANRTLLQNLLLEYPIATYIALFALFTSISTLLFTVFWINKTKHLVKKFAKDKNIISVSSVNKESGKESNKESSSPTFKRSILQYCSFLNKPQKETNKKELKIERQAEKQDYTRVKNESNQAKRENLSEDDRKKKFKVPVPPPSEFHEAPGLENFSEWNIAIHSNGSNLRKKKNE